MHAAGQFSILREAIASEFFLYYVWIMAKCEAAHVISYCSAPQDSQIDIVANVYTCAYYGPWHI